MPRPSPVRDALRGALMRAGHAATLAELHAALQGQGVPATFSAVFRAASHLQATGEAVPVDLGDGLARYEAAGQHHHEHVRCRSCGAVAEVPGCLLDAAMDSVRAATGYAIDSHLVVLAGRCPACAAGGTR